MGYLIAGLCLLLPLALVNNIIQKAHHQDPHRKPPIAQSQIGMFILRLLWLAFFGLSLYLVIVGSGWWALLWWPAGIMGAQVALIAIVRIAGR